MDSFDLFCRLSRGAKYDRQRLSKELAAFKVSLITPPQSSLLFVLWGRRTVASNWIEILVHAHSLFCRGTQQGRSR